MRLEIVDLEVGYGRTQVLFGVSLDVPAGSLTCLMGRNGVGKSTLLNAVMGLLPLRAGSVSVDGSVTNRVPTPKLAAFGVGYVPQGHQVFPHLTTLENLQVVAERSRKTDASAMDDALDVFPALRDLLERPAGLLSGGQAQQLAIARALVGRPRLLILDEPTEGIQPSIILEIEDAIAYMHRETGVTILLVEQYVEFGLRLSQRYAVMEGGMIVQSGDSARVDIGAFSDLLAV
ncbi:MAG TPA: ATP-binding cassette domain-containing protein [Acidimicrobiales bacterium]|nr:ATP-binding cassette domain-containing protein [Acidimicrobiales bacterium]